jgi:hypothetical protein
MNKLPIYTSTWTVKNTNTKLLYTIREVVVTKQDQLMLNPTYLSRVYRKFLKREVKYLVPVKVEYNKIIGYTNTPPIKEE